MKKFTIIISAFVVAALTACTLYMDEPEDEGRILRTGEGYDKPETITLPDDQGTITYEYSQKTIPITDEVEQYIVNVESDTILYFESGTPEELLPEVGEMMTCSFRDRFPHAFCHKCIERSESNGIYRCVFTKCSYKEAFAKLKFNVKPTTNIIPKGDAKLLSKEELDSILNQYDLVTDDEIDEEQQSRSINNNRITRLSFDTGKREFKGITVPLGSLKLNPSIGSLAGISAIVSGELVLGVYIQTEYDSDKDVFYSEQGLKGGFNLEYDVTANVGCKFRSPIALSLLGVNIDLVVIGLDVGLTSIPYVNIQHEINGKLSFFLGFDIGFGYAQVGNEKGEFDRKKHKFKRKRGYPAFRFLPRDFGGSGNIIPKLHVTSGVDYHLGLGADIFGTGGNVSLGIDTYQEFEQTISDDAFESVEDFQKKNAYMPALAKFYVDGTVKVLGAKVPARYESKPFDCGKVEVPLLPVYKKGSAYCYCSDAINSPYTYKLNMEFEDVGLFGYWWQYLPKARIYFEDGDKSQPVETFTLDWKKGSDMKIIQATKRSDKLLTNVPYICQFDMVSTLPGGKSFTVPMLDLPFNVEVPEMQIDEDRVLATQTMTPKNATYEDLQKKLVTNYNGERVWIGGKYYYRYRYKVDIPVEIEAPRLCKKWGLHLSDIYGGSSEFSHNEKSKKEIIKRTVRMTWYSNEKSLNLYVNPFAVIQDSEGHTSGRKDFLPSTEFKVSYVEWLDKPYSITDKQPDYECSRAQIPESWQVGTVNSTWGEKPYLGDVEVIEDEFPFN